MSLIPILSGKAVSLVSKLSGRSGSTWPGHIALSLNPKFVKSMLNPRGRASKIKVVLVAGTNGKTTTSKMLSEILEANGKKVFSNQEGANLLNGIASSLISHANMLGKINYDVAVFETDENSLPIILENVKPFAVILLNLFRDQLDRYGEVNIIADKWKKALEKLSKETLLISNGDDPMLSYISAKSGLNSFNFGLPKSEPSKSEMLSDVDFLYCPNCSTKLNFESHTYSHLGKFKCPKCHFTNPLIYSFDSLSNPLLGEYNRYNINAAALLLTEGFNIGLETIELSLKNFSPAFGRQEKIKFGKKDVFVMLSKNPASFNQSLQAVLSKEKNPNVLLVLNDRIPDGRDVSWIWDIDTDELAKKAKSITVSGDRCFDMSLRIKYSDGKFEVKENLSTAIDIAISKLKTSQTLYILPTYSAMLETRKILTGRKIL